jgi:hypothetical protein
MEDILLCVRLVARLPFVGSQQSRFHESQNIQSLGNLHLSSTYKGGTFVQLHQHFLVRPQQRIGNCDAGLAWPHGMSDFRNQVNHGFPDGGCDGPAGLRNVIELQLNPFGLRDADK